jgi:hypothetical protein
VRTTSNLGILAKHLNMYSHVQNFVDPLYFRIFDDASQSRCVMMVVLRRLSAMRWVTMLIIAFIQGASGKIWGVDQVLEVLYIFPGRPSAYA